MTNFGWWSSQVPPGWFLCSLCFEGKPIAQAWRDEHGQAWDSCHECEEEEQVLLRARERPDPPPAAG